jgi:hypothetical protein
MKISHISLLMKKSLVEFLLKLLNLEDYIISYLSSSGLN